MIKKNILVTLSKNDWSFILEAIHHNRVLYDKISIQLDKAYRKKKSKENMVSIAERYRSDSLNNPTIYEVFCNNVLKGLRCKVVQQKIFYYTVGKSTKPNRFFIVDFYIPKYKTVLEVDGKPHYTKEGIKNDTERTEMLKMLGVEKVVRIKNSDCNLNNVNSLLDSIRK